MTGVKDGGGAAVSGLALGVSAALTAAVLERLWEYLRGIR